MKKLLLALAITCSLLPASAQNYLQWATYYGGSDQDISYNLTTDPFGNVYLVGQTESTSGIASPGAWQTTIGGGVDAFIVKFNPAGNRLWATYYGGTGSDIANGVKTDALGNVYMVGYTSSTTGIASPGAFQTVFGGTNDAFLVKFDASGNRLWATYYGGANLEWGSNAATDAAGNVYLAGYTQSITGIATVGAYQTIFAGGSADAFLVKFDGSGNRIWGTYFGGTDVDAADDIASDASGNVVMSGTTYSTSGIATGGFQNTYGGGLSDAFVAKFNPIGGLVWSSYYGGTGDEEGFGICTGPANCVYLAGITSSASGIASLGFQNTFGGINDAFLVKFNATGGRVWATYYGGASQEEGEGVAADAAGNVFLSGGVYSPNVGNSIATVNGFQTNIIGTENAFLAAFNGNGLRLAATYYGKIHEESPRVAVTSFGAAYMSIWTSTSTGMTSGGFQNTWGGNPYDGFLVKFYTAVPDTNIIVPNDNLPPVITAAPTTTMPPKIYVTSSVFDGGSVTISNLVLKNFSPGSPLPASGSSTVTFTCSFTGTYTGTTSVAVSGSATGQMKATFASSSGSTRVYDTEMLQLNLSGGSMPTGVQLRESPTLVSTGQTVVTPVGGGLYSMSSFFDVFTELSTDGGSSWQPNSAPQARMSLHNDTSASVPTLSEWGLIALGLLVLGMGIFFVTKRIA